MTTNSAHTSIWQTSDAIVLVCLSIGLALEFFVYDFNLPVGLLWIRIGLGSLMVLAGVLVIILAKIEFNKESQPATPGKPTTRIVDSGIFGFSRNPIYLGLAIVVPGMGLMFNLVWWIILTLPLVLVLQKVLITPEEHYLTEQFGEEYRQYVSKVRPWA